MTTPESPTPETAREIVEGVLGHSNLTLTKRVAAALAEQQGEINILEAAILKAHPSGSDKGANPLKVLETLSREWTEEITRGPETPLKFWDGEVEREIAWEIGDADDGMLEGYFVEPSDEPTYTDLRNRAESAEAKLAELQAAHLELVLVLGEMLEWCDNNVQFVDINPLLEAARAALSGANTEKYRELLEAVKLAVDENFGDGGRPFVLDRLGKARAALQSTGEPTKAREGE